MPLFGHRPGGNLNILADSQFSLTAQQDYVFVLEAFYAADPKCAERQGSHKYCTEADSEYGAPFSKSGKVPANPKINAVDNPRSDSERGQQPDQVKCIAHRSLTFDVAALIELGNRLTDHFMQFTVDRHDVTQSHKSHTRLCVLAGLCGRECAAKQGFWMVRV